MAQTRVPQDCALVSAAIQRLQSGSNASSIPVDLDIPLFIDFDGTLIRSDSLVEGFLRALQRHPVACLKACFSLLHGRAQFKRRIAELAAIDVRLLPYRSNLLALLTAEASAGRRLILATAADELVARPVVEFLGIFDYVISSDGQTNCKGESKLRAIRQVSGRFLYAGDSSADHAIWKASAGAILAAGSSRVRESLRRSGVPIYAEFPARASWRTVVQAIRVRQWPKNLLVLLPIFLGHRVMEVEVWGRSLLAMAAFCATASLAHVINDLTDLEADRQHRVKKSRPFASGELSPIAGFAIAACLSAAGIGLALCLPASGRQWIVVYFAATLLYSFSLKTKLLADVVALALLYSIRVMAGGAATNLAISQWTLAFCLFVFYSLALGKRFGELRALPDDRNEAPRRGYQKTVLPIVAAAGVASGVLFVFVFALYICSPEVRMHYTSPMAVAGLSRHPPLVWPLLDSGKPRLPDRRSHSFYAEGSPQLLRRSLCIGLVWLAASVIR